MPNSVELMPLTTLGVNPLISVAVSAPKLVPNASSMVLETPWKADDDMAVRAGVLSHEICVPKALSCVAVMPAVVVPKDATCAEVIAPSKLGGIPANALALKKDTDVPKLLSSVWVKPCKAELPKAVN